MTGPDNMQILYDIRICAGYSCLTQIGPDHVGVLYEGLKQMFFQGFGIEDLVK